MFTSLNSKINFTKGTLGGDVLTAINNANIGVTFYKNSNVPNNRPSGCDWGAYYIIKESSTNASIIYIGRDRIACSYSVDATNDTSITWYVGAYLMVHTQDTGSITIAANSEARVVLSTINAGNVFGFYAQLSGTGYTQCVSYLESNTDNVMWIRNNSSAQVTLNYIAHRIYRN